MCVTTVDIQSATAEIRRGKKTRRKRKETGQNIMSASTMQGGHKKTKTRFSHLLRHPVWKWRGPILIRMLHEFVTHLLT